MSSGHALLTHLVKGSSRLQWPSRWRRRSDSATSAVFLTAVGVGRLVRRRCSISVPTHTDSAHGAETTGSEDDIFAPCEHPRVSQQTPLRRPLSRTVEDSTYQGVPNAVFVGQQQEYGDHDRHSRELRKGGYREISDEPLSQQDQRKVNQIQPVRRIRNVPHGIAFVRHQSTTHTDQSECHQPCKQGLQKVCSEGIQSRRLSVTERSRTFPTPNPDRSERQ